MTEPSINTFRSSGWVKLFALLAALVFLAGAVLCFRAQGWSWMTLLFSALALVAMAGFLDTLTARVELHPDHIVIVRNLRKATYPRATFARVTWGKGVPVSLQSTSGDWVKLPGVGRTAPGLANTLRAWIKT